MKGTQRDGECEDVENIRVKVHTHAFHHNTVQVRFTEHKNSNNNNKLFQKDVIETCCNTNELNAVKLKKRRLKDKDKHVTKSA